MLNLSGTFVLRLFLLEKIELRAFRDFCPKRMSKREKTALINTLKFIANHEDALRSMMDPSSVEEIEADAAKNTPCETTESCESADHVCSWVTLPFKRGDNLRKIPVPNIG